MEKTDIVNTIQEIENSIAALESAKVSSPDLAQTFEQSSGGMFGIGGNTKTVTVHAFDQFIDHLRGVRMQLLGLYGLDLWTDAKGMSLEQ